MTDRLRTKLSEQITQSLHDTTPMIVERDEIVRMTMGVIDAIWPEIEWWVEQVYQLRDGPPFALVYLSSIQKNTLDEHDQELLDRSIELLKKALLHPT